ncbi:MAG: hypothetical protein K2O43_03640, partial [Muribaculaceae bacterium]|nr:hypothetical protein [Muribaculaceae bacterium]
HGSMTPTCFMGEEVRSFMRTIADEVALDAERRERMRKRREAKKAIAEREAREREMQAQQEAEQSATETPQTEAATTQNMFKSIDYAAYPEMFIIEGFIKYLIATGDTQLTSILPKGVTLESLEHTLSNCFITGQRYSNISRFTTTMRSNLRHALKQCTTIL